MGAPAPNNSRVPEAVEYPHLRVTGKPLAVYGLNREERSVGILRAIPSLRKEGGQPRSVDHKAPGREHRVSTKPRLDLRVLLAEIHDHRGRVLPFTVDGTLERAVGREEFKSAQPLVRRGLVERAEHFVGRLEKGIGRVKVGAPSKTPQPRPCSFRNRQFEKPALEFHKVTPPPMLSWKTQFVTAGEQSTTFRPAAPAVYVVFLSNTQFTISGPAPPVHNIPPPPGPANPFRNVSPSMRVSAPASAQIRPRPRLSASTATQEGSRARLRSVTPDRLERSCSW